MINIDINEELSTLTTIDKPSIDKLMSKLVYCFSDAVDQCLKSSEESAVLNIGFGRIIMSVSNDEVKYKFVPSRAIEEAVANTIIDGKNLLINEVEKSLVNKITNIYKDMF